MFEGGYREDSLILLHCLKGRGKPRPFFLCYLDIAHIESSILSLTIGVSKLDLSKGAIYGRQSHWLLLAGPCRI